MTTPNIEQVEKELVEVICKAVPEILDVQAGSVLLNEQGRRTLITYVDERTASAVVFAESRGEKYEFNELLERKKLTSWKNEGRPITLEDVLRAAYSVASGGQLWVEMGGTMEFRYRPNILRIKSLFGSWSLGQPLSEQSPETKLFLHSLLTK